MERLQKVIAQAGVCSRRKAEELIKEGHVLVNNKLVTTLGVKVSEDDYIKVNNKTIKRERSEYYMLYKPRSVISSTNDDKDRSNVTEYIKSRARLYPVGRLDYDTTGLLLMSNDGDFANKMMHPKNKVTKTYLVYIKGVITGLQLAQLEKGVIIDGYLTKPAKARIMKKNVKHQNSVIRLTISEGKNHQVKKMIDAVGLKVDKLHREKYGHLDLKGLEPGAYRKLSQKEVSQLLELAETGYLDY